MTIELNIVMRDDLGKGASRRLRHAGKLPAIIYGEGKDPVSITLEQKDVQYVLPNEAFYSQIISLNMDGKKENVLLRDIQYHPFKIDVMHLDFLRFDATHAVHVHVPLHFLGEEESPAVKTEDGVFNHVLMEVEVECLPKDIPSFIDVDLSGMSVNDVVHLSDLKLPEGVELMALKHGEEYDTAVVSAHVRRVSAAAEEEEADEAAASAAASAAATPSEGEEGS